MSSLVSVSELHETVERMERRLRPRKDDLSIQLIDIYNKLISRFKSDLHDERAELLSRGAALMLIQEFLHEEERK